MAAVRHDVGDGVPDEATLVRQLNEIDVHPTLALSRLKWSKMGWLA
jgi:hypothetical protein